MENCTKEKADTPIDEETGNDLGEALSLTAHLYDSTHKEVDFYNESLNLSCEWSWFYYNVGSGESVSIKEVFRTDSKGNKISINKCFLEHKKLNLNKRFKMYIPKHWALNIIDEKEYNMLLELS